MNKPIKIQTGKEYIQTFRNRNLKVYLLGELVEEPIDHPMFRPAINALSR